MVVGAIVLFCTIFFILSETLTRFRPLSLAGNLPLAFAGFIALESVLLNFLSLFQAVNSLHFAAMHIVVIACWLYWVWMTDRKRPVGHVLLFCKLFKAITGQRAFQILMPLIILISFTAWLYPPNNYDSLTYHMARVAHWMQNSSIDYYPTPIERQNVMSPGAEYLILFFQLLSDTDQLAVAGQLLSYIFLIISLGYILRILHIPKYLIPYILILSATAPIAVMQASATKNDLVASLMAISLLIACARLFAGKVGRMTNADFVLIGIAGAAGFLVKATLLLVVLPILAVAGCLQLPELYRQRKGVAQIFKGGIIIMVVFCCIAGPDMYRKSTEHIQRHEVYPLFSGYTVERLWNPVRTMVHNVPFPDQTRMVLAKMGVRGDLITKDVYNLHEDMVGNPFQASTFLVLSLLTILLVFFGKTEVSSRKKFILALSPLASWLAFGLVVKDQGWITRLQIPLFYLLPFSFISIAALGQRYRLVGMSLKVFTAIVSFFSLACAFLVAANVPARPLVLSHFWGEKPSRDGAYYNNANLKADHDLFLSKVGDYQCRNVGLVVGPDSVDYPLTWRLMRQGVEVRHAWKQVQDTHGKPSFIVQPEVLSQSCMLYVDTGSIEHVPQKGVQWLDVGDDHTFVRNSKLDFMQAGQTCLRIDAQAGIKQLKVVHDVRVRAASESITLTVEGNDPQLILPAIDRCGVELAVMRLEMTSPAATVVQLFYMTETSRNYTEKYSVARLIAKGRNTIYIPIPKIAARNRLRLDVGKVPGTYDLHSLVIRSAKSEEIMDAEKESR